MSSQRRIPSNLHGRGGLTHTNIDMSVRCCTISPYGCDDVYRYYHRSINIEKLIEVKFTHVPRSMTVARMIRMFKLPEIPHFGRDLREMEDKDIPEVAALFARYMHRFEMAPEMTVDEIRHLFLSGRGEGVKEENNRRKGQVIWSYVVEVRDFFFSFSLCMKS